MEGAPVTAATGVLGPVVAKLGALLSSDYKLRRQTRKDVKSIRSKLKSVHSILWAIWEKEDLDAESKVLKKEALDLAADMDDAIDDFILTMQGSHRSKRLIERKIEVSPFQDFKRRVDDVSARCHSKWKWKDRSAQPFSSLFAWRNTKSSTPSQPPPPPRRAPFVRKDVSELVCMDGWRNELTRYLVGEEESTMVELQLKIVSIVGMAGVGKTTLASLVYGDEEIANKFQSRSFVSVTSTPNMKEVLTSILQQVGAQPPAGTEARTEEHIIHTISNFLENKRYLVIIDDIWNREQWDIIRRPFPVNNLGSRIVMTSRIHSMRGYDFDNNKPCIRMNPQLSFDKRRWLYGPDREDVAARMKPDMVGEGFDCDHPIVRMCGGVPLALLCMFSAMAMVCQQQEQARDVQDMIEFERRVKQSGIQNTPGFEPLVESLQLGYNDLPHHMLKTCLLYCSIYPENYKFYGDDLVMRWIAEGFIYELDAGKGYLEELGDRGLLMLLEDKDEKAYQMNPVMRNFLGWKLREGNFITCSSDITSSCACRIHRLCMDDYSADGAAEGVDPLFGLYWSQIRSLVVFEGAKTYVPFEKLEHVRVLDLQYHQRLRETRKYVHVFEDLDFEALGNDHVKDICGLLRVRHLFGLEGKGISEIPPEIARLQYLETLHVRRTLIRELPSEIGDLQQLKTLVMSRNLKLAELPREIGDLKNLETLDLSYNQELTELPREIRKLQNLKQLLLTFIPVTKLPKEMVGLKKLKKLALDSAISALPWETSQLSNLEGVAECVRQAWKNSDLVSEFSAEILSIQMDAWTTERGGLTVGTKHMHIPWWIKDHFNDLAYLDIRICKLEEQDLKILREMPSLKDLKLRLEVVPRKPIVISGEGFPRLMWLVVDSRASPIITFQEGAMPELHRLIFEFQFYGGPPANKDPPCLGINHLRNLYHVEFRCNEEWYKGAAESSPCVSAMIDVVRKEAQEHPRWIEILVSGRKRERFPRKESAQEVSSSDGSGAEIQEETLEAA
ncbi:hypothetical protein CFC21_055793 [Triticum aestivum]|uniref:NB-ARC domain-containing protein n=2 Tax=Triticum aestivum TaxID=4565 RepID=A0A1D5X9P4_WHEAT|nr:disease resistance protein Pik-1-like isoform X1 [Triticum aestivum]XP_044361549.1 disease resistance protein Pik-1-like isoform X1 [Triticum aestivum]XP_044446547.1 disease resistance protein Pik-1-like isoform X1 [Triticum aestivum]XP_044446548.1 disease resistance protein Pik-1-like isoform X1 [Triticum aestivum]KAF7046790.1 hypothetical protein CFC21_055793 [Triticum aestivum]